MASSKVMSSSTSRNSDRSRRSSSSTKPSSVSDHNKNGNNHHLAAMTVDGLLRNVYAGAPSGQTTLLNAEITLLASATTAAAADGQTDNSLSIPRQESFSNVHKTVDDVWKEIVTGERKECKEEEPDEMMTLEDFLARAEAVEEDEVKMPQPLTETDTERLSGGVFAFEPIPSSPFQATQVEGSAIGFGNGVDVIGGGRGKRRAAVLEPLDKAAQQRQRRMIKNRESAARSRERKQAYQVELESLAVKLEEENERLLKEKEERTKERFKLDEHCGSRIMMDFLFKSKCTMKVVSEGVQRISVIIITLMEKVVPVVEQRRPARVLRRVRSWQW